MPRTTLELEFLADHKKLTQGFQKLIAAVEENSPEETRRLADELDLVAGPHIEFEEHTLYPTVEGARGAEFGKALRREHQVARTALQFLQSQNSSPLSNDDRARVLEQLRVGFDHAVACGSLLSHLTVMTPVEQGEMLATLRSLRTQKLRWTELGGA